MAASLSTPAQFSKKPNGEEKVQLLPPSSFEVPGSKHPAPWQELVQATGEVLQLKEENKQLRDARHITIPAGEEIKARVDIHQAPPPQAPQPIGLHHLDDIINRQAAEINDLKKQLSQSEARYQREAARLQSQVVLKDAQNTQQVAALEAEIGQLKIFHQAEEDRTKAEHDRLVSEHEALVTSLKETLSAKATEHQTAAENLQRELSQMREMAREKEMQLEATIKEQSQSLAEQEQKISQLKLYLTETQDSSKSTEIWKKEVENLRWKAEQSEKEKQNLQSSIQLLNIRLVSQNEILSVQEKELSKVKEASTDKKKHCLLTRWREKVYQLLVQLKCQELVQKDEERKWLNKISDAESQTQAHRTQCEVLQHSLADKQAEFDLEQNNLQSLQEELTKAQQVALMLDDRSQEDRQRMVALVTVVTGLQEQYERTEQRLYGANNVLKSHSQRIAFASGRVQMLQAQFARRDALLRLQLKEDGEEVEKPTRDNDPDSSKPDSSLLDQLTSELERVTSERNQLVEQLRADSLMLETKVQAARSQYAEEVELLKQRSEELHCSLEEKTQACDAQTNRLVAAQAELTEAQETVQSLKVELAKSQLGAEKDAEKQRREDQAQFTEQLADMEHRLNEARREHTKAVVSWRQLERQSARDKERAAEHARLLEQHYTQQLHDLEIKARSLERDRNLLMATLRQEGLIGKYKGQRSSPLTTTLDGDTADSVVMAAVPTTSSNRPAAGNTDPSQTGSPFTAQHEESNEPLHTVIDELKLLSAEVMKSDDDDDDDDEDGDDERDEQSD